MQKNTKILLGLGLVALAYYLWQKSSKPKVTSSPKEEVSPYSNYNRRIK